ncbi:MULTISPECIES: arsenate reductase (glutaredoxin) [Vibrio]|uniref:arsenate reductase (glutaredoxin) n=1 Tax=Vibrio TaxID=662 RepID=UPI00097E3224|nr:MULTISPECIES: arsenate reductase (glutaredoxin) [Vibrio]AQM19058.1 arsenate reductase (glutaredoxin) [Vibrio anguillarum]AQP35606.1 arsenate reductase (glutaredoxin) [Vibrio anguillarum]ASG08001.1 arsenate reductase (glutaredoxin) [Vibrio anguillarum]ATC58164.1 arsenate reductase (glutaredoxin) [Vibrio anguillarum]AUB87448.1 arsenate reductase (glutaredoxin) [Vibrio anguillarum]
MSVVIYHNPKCSKSRETLALLEDRQLKPQIIKYLDQTPTIEQLKTLYAQLGLQQVRDMMRTKEDLYKELGLSDDALTDDQLFSAMAAHPKLIERPIVVANGKARHGRPPEQVLEIL